MISQSIKNLINFKTLTNPNTYFPGLMNRSHKELWGSKIHFNQEETNLCQSIIKNIEIDIFEIKDRDQNAFTVPGIGSIKDLKTDPIKYNLDGLKYLSKTPLTFTIDSVSKHIIFNNKDFKILIFVNSGLIKKLKEEVGEFLEEKNTEELADIIEVVNAIKKLSEFENVEEIRLKKLEEKGGFEKRIILKGNK